VEISEQSPKIPQNYPQSFKNKKMTTNSKKSLVKMGLLLVVLMIGTAVANKPCAICKNTEAKRRDLYNNKVIRRYKRFNCKAKGCVDPATDEPRKVCEKCCIPTQNGSIAVCDICLEKKLKKRDSFTTKKWSKQIVTERDWEKGNIQKLQKHWTFPFSQSRSVTICFDHFFVVKESRFFNFFSRQISQTAIEPF
jgi:hypothetical protein